MDSQGIAYLIILQVTTTTTSTKFTISKIYHLCAMGSRHNN